MKSPQIIVQYLTNAKYKYQRFVNTGKEITQYIINFVDCIDHYLKKCFFKYQ